VIVNDHLKIADELEKQAQFLVESYKCEWREAVKDPVRRRMFRQFVNSSDTEPGVEFVVERGQKRPAGWPSDLVQLEPLNKSAAMPAETDGVARWHRVGRVSDFPKDAGACVKVEGRQIAIYRFSSRNEWYACQNMCPHKREMVLSRGLLGDSNGTPKVACPIHKKTFALESGKCLSGDDFSVETYAVKVEGDYVFLQVPVLKECETPASDAHDCHCNGSAVSCTAAADLPAQDEVPCLAP
jgi:nitrite reductase (NADH) large subunit